MHALVFTIERTVFESSKRALPRFYYCQDHLMHNACLCSRGELANPRSLLPLSNELDPYESHNHPWSGTIRPKPPVWPNLTILSWRVGLQQLARAQPNHSQTPNGQVSMCMVFGRIYFIWHSSDIRFISDLLGSCRIRTLSSIDLCLASFYVASKLNSEHIVTRGDIVARPIDLSYLQQKYPSCLIAIIYPRVELEQTVEISPPRQIQTVT